MKNMSQFLPFTFRIRLCFMNKTIRCFNCSNLKPEGTRAVRKDTYKNLKKNVFQRSLSLSNKTVELCYLKMHVNDQQQKVGHFVSDQD